MTAPNIVNVVNITAKVAGIAATTSAQAIVSNAASSNTVVKVNSLVAANITALPVSFTVDLYKDQTTAYRLAYQITVPANSTLVVLGKSENGIYLEENDSIRVLAASNSAIEVVCSYEVLT